MCKSQSALPVPIWTPRFNMAEAELAAVFDLLRITLGKTDQTRNKAEALSGLVHTAVQRALQAQDLAGDPTEITQIVLTMLRYITGGC